MSVNICIHLYLNQFFEKIARSMKQKLDDTTVVSSENKPPAQPPIPSPRSNCLSSFFEHCFYILFGLCTLMSLFLVLFFSVKALR